MTDIKLCSVVATLFLSAGKAGAGCGCFFLFLGGDTALNFADELIVFFEGIAQEIAERLYYHTS